MDKRRLVNRESQGTSRAGRPGGKPAGDVVPGRAGGVEVERSEEVEAGAGISG